MLHEPRRRRSWLIFDVGQNIRVKASGWLALFAILTMNLRADQSAIAFYVVEVRQLESLAAGGSPHDVPEEKLREVAKVSGYVIGSAFSVTTNDTSLSVSIDSWGEPEFIYRVSAFSGRERKPMIEVSGVAKGNGQRYATDNWRRAYLAVVFRHVNLKK
jgi:hypothetical protein